MDGCQGARRFVVHMEASFVLTSKTQRALKRMDANYSAWTHADAWTRTDCNVIERDIADKCPHAIVYDRLA